MVKNLKDPNPSKTSMELVLFFTLIRFLCSFLCISSLLKVDLKQLTGSVKDIRTHFVLPWRWFAPHAS
jgi:hypothetical protein